RHGANPAQDLEQVIVVLADDLGEHVERAGGDDDVIDLLHVGELPGHFLQVAIGLDGDHGLPPEAQGQRIGDGDDLHHAGVLEALHALPDGRLGQPHGLADRGVGAPAVLLQLLDDLLGDVVGYETTRILGWERPRASRHTAVSSPRPRARTVVSAY